jgi:far upstream element-binding protein
MQSQRLAELLQKKAYRTGLVAVSVSDHSRLLARADAVTDTIPNVAPSRDGDSRMGSRMYRRSRSRSRSPIRIPQGFRDNYNPYRDERRDDARRPNVMPYGRERTFSPDLRGPPHGSGFTPPQGRGYGGAGDNSPIGRRGGDEGVETIPIESTLVGLIIGRQGESLRRVEADTATRVQFITGPEASGPMRQCKITGSRQAREHAKQEIFRIIEENGNPGGAQSSGRAPPPPDRALGGDSSKTAGAHQPALRAGEDATQIMVPNRTVGLIIGRGGETIRDLQERSQCHVNIVGEEKSINGLRPVNLIGTPQAAGMAKDLIMEIVDSDTKSLANQGGQGTQSGAPRDRPPQAFGAGDGEKINDNIFVPSDAVGMIIGKGEQSIATIEPPIHVN